MALKLLAAGVLSTATAVAAQAMPMSPAAQSVNASTERASQLQQVYYRRGFRARYYSYYSWPRYYPGLYRSYYYYPYPPPPGVGWRWDRGATHYYGPRLYSGPYFVPGWRRW